MKRCITMDHRPGSLEHWLLHQVVEKILDSLSGTGKITLPYEDEK